MQPRPIKVNANSVTHVIGILLALAVLIPINTLRVNPATKPEPHKCHVSDTADGLGLAASVIP